jgi:hypothetical protein
MINVTTLDKPNNILEKLNTIQDNINPQNKAKNSAFLPILPQNENNNFNLNNNYYFPYLMLNYTKEDLNCQSQTNLQNNPTLQMPNHALNKKFKTSNTTYTSTKSLDEPSSEKLCLKKDELRINQAKVKNKENNGKLKKKKAFKKFKICHIEYPIFGKTEEKGKSINKLKHKRKYKPDDIRKKIKARFHKSIKNIINENLRKAGSKKLFTFLPQVFISSISREKNRRVLNLSFRDLLQKNFVNDVDEKKYKNRNVDFAKYQRNLSVLKYLDENPEICRNSGFDLISKMKYSDLLEEYFQSDEFERAIFKLREEQEDEDYIKEYISKSKTYVKFFMEMPFKIKPDKFKTISEIKPEEDKKVLSFN